MDAQATQTTSKRSAARCALSAGCLLALSSRGLKETFLVSNAGSRHSSMPSPSLTNEPTGPTILPAAERVNAFGTWSSTAASMLAAGAISLAYLATKRDESSITMFGGHDRRTFRGKQHAHTFGKYRLRKNRFKRIQKIKNGTFDPNNVKQQGQPEPEHCWDVENLLKNPMWYVPQFARDAFQAVYEDHVEHERKLWKDRMGKKGRQWSYKNWTPPELLEAASGPPAEAAAAVTGEKVSAKDVKTLRERSMAGILDCQKALAETGGDMEKAMEWLKKKGIAKADKKAGNLAVEGNIASYVHFNSKIAVLVEVNSETDFVASNAIFKQFASDVAMQVAANPSVKYVTLDEVPTAIKEKEKALEMEKEDLASKPVDVREKIVEGRLKKKWEELSLMNQKWLKDEDKTVEQVLKETIATLGENLVIRRFARLTLGEGLEKKENNFAAGVEKELEKYRSSGDAPAAPATPAPAPEAPKKEEAKVAPASEAPKVEVSAAQVKELRERSGAGILDSKKALAETGCDMEKAMEWLKKKGIAKADKKVGNLSVEGSVASYVHFNSKIGVIVEVNSETDFVALNAIFKEFAKDVAMQIAAIPSIETISADEVSAERFQKEKELEMQKEDLAGKPEEIKEKIVLGRLKKKFEDCALLNQKWLKDEEKTVQDVLKEKVAILGENIVIRRFSRLTLGEGLEKKDADFAAGVEKELAKYRN